MSDHILIDATQMSWAAFADRLTAFGLEAQAGASAQVRPPRGCASQAARLVRNLDLADRVVIGEDRPSRIAGTNGGPGPLLASLLAAVRTTLGRMRRPIHD